MLVIAALLVALARVEAPVALPFGARVADRTEAVLYAVGGGTLHAFSHADGAWRVLFESDEPLALARALGTGEVLLFPPAIRVDPSGVAAPADVFEGLRDLALVRARGAWFVHGWSGAPPWGDGVPGPHTMRVGAGMEAALFGSADRGATWTRLDRWEGGAIADVFVTDGGDLVVLREGGGVRRGPLRAADGRLAVELETLVDPEEGAAEKPYGHYGGRILFPTEEVGLIVSDFFGGGPGTTVFRTEDGGRTFAPSKTTFPEHRGGRWNHEPWVRGFLCLDSGEWRALTRKGPVRWNGAAFEAAGPGWRFHVERTLVDARGDLLVELENEQVWALGRDGAWTPVATPAGQELETPWKD